MIKVRLIQTVPNDKIHVLVEELAKVVEREGLAPKVGGWEATQSELDTPHHTFRLLPR